MTPGFIGRYRIESELGRGAMGTVFRAHDPEIDRTVAIKLVRADLLEGDARAGYLRRFRQEAQAAARCVHPNIVAIYDYATEADGNPFLAMEFVPGRPLRASGAPATRLPLRDSIALMRQLLAALECAHSVGVVHRDIKPANLLILPDGRLKVTDFGISRIDTSDLTVAGGLIGTPSTMSPEQARGDVVDARSDLFSAGVVFFELLSGQRPFAAGSAAETIRRLLDDAPADLDRLESETPPTIRAVIARALAKSVERRFQSAAEMADALRRAVTPNAVEATVLALPTGSVGWPAEILAKLETLLATTLGPIARHVVRDAVAKARTDEELCRLASDAIDDPDRRARFVRAAARLLAGDGRGVDASRSGITAMPIAAVELDRIERDLVRILGPFGRILLRRAAPAASSASMLRTTLAAHIENPNEKAAFLRSQ